LIGQTVTIHVHEIDERLHVRLIRSHSDSEGAIVDAERSALVAGLVQSNRRAQVGIGGGRRPEDTVDEVGKQIREQQLPSRLPEQLTRCRFSATSI
jgi:hypothetical protein